MVRKMLSALAAVLLVFGLALPAHAGAARMPVNDLKIEQVQVEMPEVQAWFHLNNGGTPTLEEILASLGTRSLQATELRPFDPAKDPTSYFFLVDCSTSTSYAQMEAVKTGLRQFAQQEMVENSTLTLITFGVDVQVLLQRESDPAAISAAVDGLAADQPGTLFFDALAKAIDLAAGKAYALERKVAFVFSDSVDYNLGGHTKEEVDKLLAATGLPFYAIGFDSGSKQELDNFGAVARASGGDIAVVPAEGLPAALQAMVAQTKNAWMARFDAGTNVADMATQTFSLTLEDQGLTATRDVPVRHWQADTVAPEITALEQRTEESVWLQFSKPVAGAALPQSYVVTNENGDLLGIQAAAYDEAERAVVLTFTASPPSGDYVLACPGIVDLAMEQNPVAGQRAFTFEGAAPPVETPQQPVPVGAWIFVGLLGLAILAAIVVAAVRKNQRGASATAAPAGEVPATPVPPQEVQVQQPVPAGGEMHVHFSQAPAALSKIKLQVCGPNGKGHVVEVPVNKTLFVGRSDICDVYFDDAAMSRQHFVIGEENGRYTITNLSTSGGTLLNGVRLQNPRPLQTGDTIGAGGQTIVFLAAVPGGEVH